VLGFLGIVVMSVLSPFENFAGEVLSAVVAVILGIVAICEAKKVTVPIWAIILIVVGAIGEGLGGILVLIGGILGLLSPFI
jgi:hypothetical protein